MQSLESKLPFKIKKIDHCALAPKDMKKCFHFFKELLQLPYVGSESVAEQKVHVEMLRSSTDPETCEDSPQIELLEPTDSESSIAKFLKMRGSGIHHLAFCVDNMDRAVDYLRSNGVDFVESTPRKGYGGSLVMFVHPRSTGGILCELVQYPS